MEGAAAGSAPSQSRRRLLSRRDLEFYVAITPWLIGFLLFTGGPILAAFAISLTRWGIVDTPVWVGFGNYAQMLSTDRLFWDSTFNTAYYVLFSVPLGLVVSLALA